MSSIVPRPWQLSAIEAARHHDGFGLFMQQRTGKTFAALWLAEIWECHYNLIICPKKAIPVWTQAIKDLHFPLGEFTIVSFESFRIRQREYTCVRWDLVIVDESHRIKERSSQITKAVWKLSKMARKRLILTGSPQGNGMEDYYAQLKFIRPDLFSTWKAFSENYLIIEQMTLPGREEDPFPKIVGYKDQEHFKQILANISFRVERDDVAKVKTIARTKKHTIPWSPEARASYDELDQKLMLEINDGLVSAPMILTKAGKLHQLCGGFVKDDDKELNAVHQDKLNYFWKLFDTDLKDRPMVVVANYKPEMDTLAAGMGLRGISYTQIRGKHQYDPNDRSQVTILHPSAGEAINLAHYRLMVIYSMNYSYLKWEQFKDRIVLVDVPMVEYHYLMMEDSMDFTVYGSVREKRKMSEAVTEVYKRRRIEKKV